MLPNIIHHNQCAYMSKEGPSSMRLEQLRMLWNFQNDITSEGKMISIDFKKAFDTVSRDFLFRTLSAFGFGPSFIQWIHTFYLQLCP